MLYWKQKATNAATSITSAIDDQGMSLALLGTILETDPLSTIQQTIFHR